jgi:acyl-coenzyme A synthetase/AMP-(fatty) acid ligase
MAFSTILGSLMLFQWPTTGGLLCFANSGGEVLQMVRTFGVGYLMGSVAQMQGVVKALGDGAPPPSLRTVRIIGSRITAPQLRQMRARLCNHVISVYGSTEMGRITNAEPADLERDEGAVGMVAPFATAEVVDVDGRAMSAGRDGAIRVKSDEMAVYVDEAGRPVPLVDGQGWFYPGDVGHFEVDGLLVVTGRTGEVINRGGVVVAPEAIEEVLRGFAGVEDVAVVGVTTASGVDEIWAAVVPAGKIDAQGMLNAARARLMERAPDRLFQVARLPRGESGKVMRNAVREELLGMSRQ